MFTVRRSHTARVHQKKRLQYCDTQPLIIPEHEVPDSCLPERRVIAEDGSLVRSLHFSSTFIENTTSTSPTLWVGTNSGLVLVLSLAIPEHLEARQSDGVLAVLAKEIQLQHKAPVIGIEVLDAKGSNLAKDSEVFFWNWIFNSFKNISDFRISDPFRTKSWSALRNRFWVLLGVPGRDMILHFSSSCSPCRDLLPAGSTKWPPTKAWSSAEPKPRLFPV